MGRSKAEGGLGFREFDNFNNALLAKQCWRVMTMPQSIVAVVLKEKYFRKVDLFKAPLGQRPSLIWRSLWGSLDLLREGLVWRVGNGHDIRIWGDKWIPRLSSFSIQSPVKGMDAAARVKDLIEEGGGIWKEDLVKSIFNEEDACLICSLPTSRTSLPDKQIWAFTNNGILSVKSAYHLDMCRKRNIKGEMSRREKEGWKVLWRMRVPGVVKMFMWKALLDCLPTRVNLVKRKIAAKSNYPLCGKEEESVSHVLWSCVSANDVWAGRDSPVQKWSSSGEDLFEVWDRMVRRLSMKEMEVVVSVMKQLWLRRNKFVFENQFVNPRIVSKQGLASLEYFQKANEEQAERLQGEM
ncbi:hypothetical protein CIPAW_06G023000 [Carya illinoinensis]|uniref:Reverse transcriptase zinc-binding domain-containing protein n=1 Tax=Carya illinoinensis TaxID=32201 RepID=A0A8T1Q6Y3_CARIL|nr:hypothetical protein CIPAW_06G023000 [Carya illinoinensis]